MISVGRAKFSFYSLLHWFFVFFLILNCHSVYDAGVRNYNFEVICCVIGLLLLLSYGTMKKQAVFLVIMYLAYQIPLIVVTASNTEYIFTYLIKYVLFISMVLLLMAQNPNFLEKTIYYYVQIVFCIAVISLFFHIFGSTLRILRPTGQYMLMWVPHRWINSYFGLYFETGKISLLGMETYKNSAIFAEAPIYASVVSIATTFELFYRKQRPRKSHVIVFYLTLLTAFSTTSYVYFFLSVFGILYVYYEKMRNRSLTKFFMGILAGCTAIVAVIGILLILQDKSTRGISFLTRADDLLVSLRALRDHPIFGVGFGSGNYRELYFSSMRKAAGDMGQSSDFASILAAGGLYFMLFYFIGLFGVLKSTARGRKRIILLGLILYILLISRVGETILFFTLLASGVSQIMITRKNELYEKAKIY